MEIQRDPIYERLFRIYTDANRELLLQVQSIVAPHAEALAEHFYSHLLAIEEARQFLDHQMVSERLHRSMAKWIQALFLPCDEASVEEHIKWQQKVGDVHARINVPMKLVNHGMRLLKSEMGRLLRESALPDDQKYQGLVLVNDLMDFSASLINESYVAHEIQHESTSQALKMHLTSYSLVVQLERLRSSIFSWLSRTVSEIFESYPAKKPALSSIYTSEFGLWVTYKAALLFSEHPEFVEQLKKHLGEIQETIDRINQLEGKALKEELAQAVEALNEKVSRTAWLLGDLSEQTHEQETARDPLTRLLNRRFLPSVMQSVIRVARTTASTFSLLSLDLDGFKQINDQYGHAAGDKALVFFADVLHSNTRATDYVFRMGGDEFLVILVGMNATGASAIARKILDLLAANPVTLEDGVSFSLRTSIGIVEYYGHPDYARLLEDVDEALYQAKNQGKNTFYIKQAG